VHVSCLAHELAFCFLHPAKVGDGLNYLDDPKTDRRICRLFDLDVLRAASGGGGFKAIGLSSSFVHGLDFSKYNEKRQAI
jgi:hypothetical protein